MKYIVYFFYLIFPNILFSITSYERGQIYLKYGIKNKAKEYFYQSYKESQDLIKYYSLYEYIKLNQDLKENIYLLEYSLLDMKDSIIKIKFLNLLGEFYFLIQDYPKSFFFFKEVLKIIKKDKKKYNGYQKKTIFFLEKIRYLRDIINEKHFDTIFNQIFIYKNDKFYYQQLRYIFAHFFYEKNENKKALAIYEKYNRFYLDITDYFLLFEINMSLKEYETSFKIYKKILEKYPEMSNRDQVIKIKDRIMKYVNIEEQQGIEKKTGYILQIAILKKKRIQFY